jgi:HSP20 family protein
MFTTNYPTVLERMMDWSRAMDEAVTGRAPASINDSPARAQLWLPAIDLYETEKAFVIEADLPGIHQENVDVSFDRGTLTISGTRAATLPADEKENGQLRVFVSERLNGSFSRSIRLPQHVDAENIQATFAQGVLALTVPKSKAALARKITVKSVEAAPAVTK